MPITGIDHWVIVVSNLERTLAFYGRLGFAIARPELISGMLKVKDSYNCDTLALTAGIAALEDQPWMQKNVERVRTTKRRLAADLERLGFSVVPSQANFVWATHSNRPHKEVYEGLKKRKILVRYMRFPDVPSAFNGVVTGLRDMRGCLRDQHRFPLSSGAQQLARDLVAMRPGWWLVLCRNHLHPTARQELVYPLGDCARWFGAYRQGGRRFPQEPPMHCVVEDHGRQCAPQARLQDATRTKGQAEHKEVEQSSQERHRQIQRPATTGGEG